MLPSGFFSWRKSLACGLAAFVLFELSPATAQAPLHTALTLKSALQAAVVLHPQVLRSRGLFGASQQELQAAQWARYPSFSAEARGEAVTRQSVLRVEQPVWTGGRITAQIDVADRGSLAAGQAVREAEQAALEQTAVSFYEVLRWQSRLQLADDNLAEHQRLLALIERRANAEISPQADILLAQARLQQALSEQLQAHRLLEQSRATLSQWTGLDNVALQAPSKWSADADLLLTDHTDRALAFSPVRQKLKFQAEREAASARQLEASLKPTVVAGYQHTLGDLLPNTLYRNRTYIGMSFQTGAGLSVLNNINAALMRQQAAEQEVQAHERQLRQQLQALVQEVKTLSAQIKPLQALAEQTEQLIESYVRQYQIGRKNWLDVLNAQREKSQARSSAIDTHWLLEQALFRLRVLTGDFTSETLTQWHE